ncbi:hypothetical protein [Caproiciproducens sp.]|uniref:hypothetical protein n=1 Tax=Caproiciproducens sp. TaxID=1954376 RepID=UPI0028969EFA|nr:hypothetical protein [Caproiciproducens sp.]
MTSTTSLIRRRKEFRETYLWSLKKNRGMMALMALLLFMALPMILMTIMANARNNTKEIYTSDMWTQTYMQSFRSLIPILAIPITLIFVVVLSVFLFSYMHQKRSVDLFHALPVGRSPMLLGRLLAGLTALFAPILLNFAITLAVGMSYPVEMNTCWAPILTYLLWLMLVSAAALFFCAFMAVCTGTTVDMILSILGVNAAYPLLIFLSDNFARLLLPGLATDLNPNSIILTAIAPFAAAFMPFFGDGGRISGATQNVGTAFFIWWILFALVLLAVTVILYKRRSSECAESSFAFPIPKNVICFMITAVTGLGFGLILRGSGENAANFFIGLIAGSLAAHIVTEAIYSRGFKQLRKSFAGYGIFAAVFLVAYAILATGGFGYDTRIPNAADVASVSIDGESYDGNNTVYRTDGSRLAQITPTLTEAKNIEQTIDVHKKVIEENKKSYPYSIQMSNGITYNLSYHLKNGKVLKRAYSVPYQDTKDGGYTTVFTPLTELKEYRESGNLLFYVEPEYIKSVDVNTRNNGDGLTVAPDLNTKKRLLEAMRQDSLNGTIDSNKVDTTVSISIEYKHPTELKDGKLKSYLGNYNDKIDLGSRGYQLPEKGSATVALIKELGWDK